jgi:hypothetical protein
LSTSSFRTYSGWTSSGGERGDGRGGELLDVVVAVVSELVGSLYSRSGVLRDDVNAMFEIAAAILGRALWLTVS